MGEHFDYWLKTAGALVGLLIAAFQCVVTASNAAESVRKQGWKLPRRLLMVRVPLVGVLLFASLGLYVWAQESAPVLESPPAASTTIDGPPEPQEDGAVIVATPPFQNATGRSKLIKLSPDDDRMVDQYSFIAALKFRAALFEGLKSSIPKDIVLTSILQVETAIKHIDLDQSGLFDRNTQTEIGRLLNAGVILRGTVTMFRIRSWPSEQQPKTKTATVTINLELEHVGTGQTLRSCQLEGEKLYVASAVSVSDEQAMSDALDDAAKRAFGPDKLAQILEVLKRR